MGSISLRIPSLAIAYDGPVKLVHGAGVAFCGSGHLLYGNGDAYIGEFSNGKRHGWGQVLRADGSKFQCHWSNDAPADDADANLRVATRRGPSAPPTVLLPREPRCLVACTSICCARAS